MADRTESSIVVDAAPDRVLDVIADFDAYPEWTGAVREAEVLEEDEDGWARTVRFVLDAGALIASSLPPGPLLRRRRGLTGRRKEGPRVGEQSLVALEPSLHPELVADLVQLVARPLADRVQLGVRMALVDRQELRAESQSDDGDSDLGHDLSSNFGGKALYGATFIVPCISRQCPGKVQMYG